MRNLAKRDFFSSSLISYIKINWNEWFYSTDKCNFSFSYLQVIYDSFVSRGARMNNSWKIYIYIIFCNSPSFVVFRVKNVSTSLYIFARFANKHLKWSTDLKVNLFKSRRKRERERELKIFQFRIHGANWNVFDPRFQVAYIWKEKSNPWKIFSPSN